MDKILSDLEIGHAATLLPIEEVAASAGIAQEHLEHYGAYIAKVTPGAAAAVADQPLRPGSHREPGRQDRHDRLDLKRTLVDRLQRTGRADHARDTSRRGP